MFRNSPIVAKAIPSQIIRPLSTLTCAVALTVLVGGNAAAYQMRTDQGRGVAAVDPRLNLSIRDLHLRYKLATHAGYDILVGG